MSSKVAAALAFAATVHGSAVDCTGKTAEGDCEAAMCSWTATTCKVISDATAADDTACAALIDTGAGGTDDQATCEGATDSETGCLYTAAAGGNPSACARATCSDVANCEGNAAIAQCEVDVAAACAFKACADVTSAAASDAQCAANGCLFTAAVTADADATPPVEAADAACAACADQVDSACEDGCEVDGDTACKLAVAEEEGGVDLSGLTDCAAVTAEADCTDAICTWASDACGYKACADLDATADACTPAYCKFTAAVEAVEAVEATDTEPAVEAVEAADASCATVASADAGCADLAEAPCKVAAAAASVCEWDADADTPVCKAVAAEEAGGDDDDADSGSDDAGAEGFRTMALIPLVSAAAALFA